VVIVRNAVEELEFNTPTIPIPNPISSTRKFVLSIPSSEQST
jgi:hypothetical protein